MAHTYTLDIRESKVLPGYSLLNPMTPLKPLVFFIIKPSFSQHRCFVWTKVEQMCLEKGIPLLLYCAMMGKRPTTDCRITWINSLKCRSEAVPAAAGSYRLCRCFPTFCIHSFDKQDAGSAQYFKEGDLHCLVGFLYSWL